MPRYSSEENIYPEHAPYQPSRSALRRRFGNRAIVSHGPASGDRPGDQSVRDPRTGFTGIPGTPSADTWRDFFTPSTKPVAAATPSLGDMATVPSEAFYGRTATGASRSGTNFMGRFGKGSVRSAADVRTFPGGNEYSYLRSPAPAAPPPASMNLLPSPRSGSPLVSMRNSDFSATPTADDYFGAILGKPNKFSIATGVIDRLAGPSPWEEPI